MDLLLKHLEALDITREESAIYINTIETKASTVLEFAQNTAIPRTTVYLLVESLIQKGLLREEIIGKRKQYIPVSPAELIILAKRKEQLYKETALLLQKDIAQLHSIYNREREKPLMFVKQGIQSAKEIFTEASRSQEVLLIFTSKSGQDILNDQLDQLYELITKNMVKSKLILVKTHKNEEIQKQNSTERNMIGLLEDAYSLGVDYLIYKDTLVIITYQSDTPHIILIKDQDLAYSEKIKFNLLYERTS
jgi:sugar-specific transcriptional regulator TrmB